MPVQRTNATKRVCEEEVEQPQQSHSTQKQKQHANLQPLLQLEFLDRNHAPLTLSSSDQGMTLAEAMRQVKTARGIPVSRQWWLGASASVPFGDDHRFVPSAPVDAAHKLTEVTVVTKSVQEYVLDATNRVTVATPGDSQVVSFHNFQGGCHHTSPTHTTRIHLWTREGYQDVGRAENRFGGLDVDEMYETRHNLNLALAEGGDSPSVYAVDLSVCGTSVFCKIYDRLAEDCEGGMIVVYRGGEPISPATFPCMVSAGSYRLIRWSAGDGHPSSSSSYIEKLTVHFDEERRQAAVFVEFADNPNRPIKILTLRNIPVPPVSEPGHFGDGMTIGDRSYCGEPCGALRILPVSDPDATARW
jgi:hypothetical protein